jgi:thymidine phosphorylase
MQLDDFVLVHRTGTVEVTTHVVTAIAAVVGTGVAKDAARAVTISAATLA